MEIKELNRAENKTITVTLDYDECRDIANCLYLASQEKPQYAAICNEVKFLFDMIKEGRVMPETIKGMYESISASEDRMEGGVNAKEAKNNK